jgi:hypothetical protein
MARCVAGKEKELGATDSPSSSPVPILSDGKSLENNVVFLP